MAAVSHLERMGRELKCPICLSLLNSAVALTCNHVFCNSCLEKSLRSSSLCPVCKMPYRRREIRPSPNMNNLVTVYKSMKTSSGAKILVSQEVASSSIPVMGEVKLACDDNDDPRNNLKTSTTAWFSEKSAREGYAGELFNHQGSSRHSEKPSYPVKKRVQVPERVYSGHGIVQEKTDGCETIGIAEEKLQPQKRSFTPFFSLGGNDDPEKSSTETDESTPMYTPPEVPNFRDIKDLDDDVPKASLMDDSEMFDWTQRPCSPELCSSPLALQFEDLVEENCTSGKFKSSSAEAEKNLQIYSRKRRSQSKQKMGGTTSPMAKISENMDSGVTETRRSKRAKNIAVDVKPHGETDKVNHQGMQEKTIENSAFKRSCGNTKNARLDTSSPDGNVAGVFDCTEAVGNRKESESATILVTRNKRGGSQRNGMMKCRNRRILKTLEACEIIGESERDEKQSKAEVPNVDQATFCLKEPVLLKCSTSAKTICCAFCQSFEVTEVSGVMMCYKMGKLLDHQTKEGSAIHLHKSCAEWAPNVYFEGGEVVNLEAELSRSRRIKCSCCGLRGAALGCYAKSCRRSFHVPCAKLTPDCRWDYENFVMLCPIHASSQLPCDGQQSQINHGKEQATQRKSSVRKSEGFGSQWTSNKFKGLILCFSGLTNEEKETVNEFERLSGARILKSWKSNVTHVIASRDENGACRRTLKFLMGILEGKWVLGVEWIRACMDAGDLVDEHPYEVSLDVHGIRDGPRLGRSRLMEKQARIFQGYQFFVMGEFSSSYKEFLHDLVMAAGGKILSREPVGGDDAASTYIVYNIETLDKRVQAEALARSTGAHLASNQWILNSMAGYRLQDM